MRILSAIIVSYNTRVMTLECLRTLYAGLGDLDAEVWVVDNASTDGSVEAIRTAFPDVKIIANWDNRGFGAANNQAMCAAQGEYFLLLNSDAFPKPGAVQALVDYLRAHPEVGVVGPRLVYGDGSMQLSCFRMPSPAVAWYENLWVSSALPESHVFGNYRRWPHDRERIVDYVIGACMLVRRECYEQIGGFDEGFFMYAEEADWQRRIAQQGLKVAFTPTAEVVHLAGGSGRDDKPRVSEHFFRSHDYFYRKHFGLGGLISYRLAIWIGSLLRMVGWSAVALVNPNRRVLARAKARLYSWLVVRQATRWGPGVGKAAAR